MISFQGQIFLFWLREAQPPNYQGAVCGTDWMPIISIKLPCMPLVFLPPIEPPSGEA